MAAWVLVWVLCLAWAWATSLDTPPDTSSAVSPSLRVVGTRLEVDFGPADPGAQLLLLLLPDPGQGCLSPRALVFRRENITVSGPTANVSSLHPVEVGRSPPAMATPGGCSSWNATIVVTASYTSSWVEADVQVHQWPRCRHQFRVGLWEVLRPPGPGEEPCVFDIAIVQEVQRSLEGVNSSVVHFENMTAGNYCVRFNSSVVHFENMTAGNYCVRPPVPGPVGEKAPLPPDIHAALPVVKVVYSRDCEAHNEVVWRLCTLLRSELGLAVEYDEGAPGRAHLSADWALAMADVACPLFPGADGAPEGHRRERLLVIESEGGLIKQAAYRRDKDVGLSSGSMWDDLYHTTYTALLSRQAQALGDYCHILVARFSYSPSSPRLDLVPEKRYVLPTHMRELLEALLHGWMDEKDVPARIQSVCASDAHTHFQEALMNACNTLEENPGLVRDRFKAIADC
ncbi:hypothetical protein IscW_ISCW014353 [Ixodes scapularis]|uniref:Uncharacterized protein n=1 Tax=Ixodes scapularis TaxID=6945 RepID=B7QKN4_IXOSC|nr:hypothetical protein IscW_ISCW014353 [Ixodes scapularis]|eukprot:XP_002415740.1 hypothetical protein IscW_ISCW014353 [Ixodes scapularis]